MTLKLQLSPNLERRLELQASRSGQLLEVYVLSLLEQLSAEAQVSQNAGAARLRRRPGSAKGLIRMTPDFDAPLEDFEAYR